MSLIVGFDPGGANAFGWAVVRGAALPLEVEATGIANGAAEAVFAINAIVGERTLAAAAIDAPLYLESNDRRSDVLLRARIRKYGGHSATVNHVNSLRGACLAQGQLAALMLRRRYPALPMSEAHPKALLYILGIASAKRHSTQVRHDHLRDVLRGLPSKCGEHVRDAAISCLSAWAMLNNREGWSDLSSHDDNAFHPIAPHPGYWMPNGDRVG